MSRAISAVRSTLRRAKRYGLPLALVVTVGAMPGTVLRDRQDRDHDSPVGRWDDDSWTADAIDPRRPAPDQPDPELVAVAGSISIDPRGGAPVIRGLSSGGIPEVALRAYLAAQATMAANDPGCGLRWSLVAAIGRVESNHGRFGGAQLRADGTTTRPIRGIPLDGRAGVATIRDTDDGRLDGDRVYDRAVGPMQFIPSSWRFAGADGNGDGIEDPDNIFDAALAAAGYLCAGDTDLRNPVQRARAVFRYNHSDEYVAVVLALAEQYEWSVTAVPSVPPAPTPPPPLPSPELPPASVTQPPLGREPARPTLPTSTTSTTSTSTSTVPGATSSTTTTSTTTSGPPPSSSTTSTSTTEPCPTTTTTSTVPGATSSTTTTSTTTTTTTTAPGSTSTTTSTVPPGCPQPTTGTTAPAGTTTTAPDTAFLLGGVAFLPLYVVCRRSRAARRRV